MSCNNTVDNVNFFSSDNILWQGDDISCLGITTGMLLTSVEAAIANRVCELASEIDVSTVTPTSDILTLMASKDKTIANLIQALNDESKTLRDLLTAIGVVVNTGTSPLVLDFKCIDTVLDPCNPTNFTLQNILQIIINAFCDLKTSVTNTTTTILTTVTQTVLDTVTNMLTTCQSDRIVPMGTGTSKTLKFRGFVPPFVPMPYFGPLGYFDGDGKGLDNGPMCDWYLCNGKFGTPDLRGRVIPCAITGMGGGALSPDVDYTLSANTVTPTAQYAVGDTGGKIRHKLVSNEIPAHNHNMRDPGHAHDFNFVSGRSGNGSEFCVRDPGSAGAPTATVAGAETESYMVKRSTTGITLDSVGGDAYHENRMPYKAAAYIMMLL